MTHYIVDLAALAMGYIVAGDLDDDGAQDIVNQIDAAVTDTAADLANAFEEDLFPNAPPRVPLSPKSSRAPWPLGHNQDSSQVALVTKQSTFEVCNLGMTCFIYVDVSFPVAWENFNWDRSFSRAACRQSGEEERLYPAEGVGRPWLARLYLLATHTLLLFV
jgi:hypothetical protein